MMEASGHTVEIIEPVVPYQDSTTPQFSPSLRPANLEGKEIAFIANWKHQSLPFMEAFAAAASHRLHLKNTVALQPDWDITEAEGAKEIVSELEALAEKCDVMVTGVGD